MVERSTALRLVFCGTPEFAVPSLAATVTAGHEVALVLTQPDRPAGRGMQMLSSPVKLWAQANSLPVEQPQKLRNNEALQAQLEAVAPDAIVVVAYGRIIPSWMLALPRLGCINLHGSLLPKYRGAAPIQWAVANGEVSTGVTTMLLEEGLDTGPILERLGIPVAQDATAAELFPRLATMGAPLLISTLAGLASHTLRPMPQDPTQATHAPILKRDDGRVDFTRNATAIYNRWRGFQPWPGAWTLLDGKKLTMTRIRVSATNTVTEPGTLTVEGDRLFAACGESTAIELLDVQIEGKRTMPASDFLRGHIHLAGVHLD